MRHRLISDNFQTIACRYWQKQRQTTVTLVCHRVTLRNTKHVCCSLTTRYTYYNHNNVRSMYTPYIEGHVIC